MVGEIVTQFTVTPLLSGDTVNALLTSGGRLGKKQTRPSSSDTSGDDFFSRSLKLETHILSQRRHRMTQ